MPDNLLKILFKQANRKEVALHGIFQFQEEKTINQINARSN